MENLNELKPVGKLSPFTRFCCTIGNLPTSYMISLTYEEQLLWLCNYLEKTVIPAVNTNAEAVAEIQNLYIELKNYVDNYFEDLNIQEEINNKLDEMAESGELAEIISEYLQLSGIFTFNNMNELLNAENLINNSKALVFGKENFDDAGFKTFIIKDETTLEVDNKNVFQLNSEKYAILVNKSIFKNNVTYERFRFDDTNCFIVNISKNDNYGNKNILKIGIANDHKGLERFESTTNFAKRHNATLCTNAGIFNGVEPFQIWGACIIDGEIVINNPVPENDPGLNYLTIDENGHFGYETFETTAEEMIQKGVKNAVAGFFPIIVDGEAVSHEYQWVDGKAPRQIVCENTDGSQFIFACEGRLLNNEGLLFEDIQNYLFENYPDIKFAMAMDGGGSLSVNVYKQKLNVSLDNGMRTDRPVPYFLYLANENATNTEQNDLNKILDVMSEQIYNLQTQINRLNTLNTDSINMVSGSRYPIIKIYGNGSLENVQNQISFEPNAVSMQAVDLNGENLDNVFIATKYGIYSVDGLLGMFQAELPFVANCNDTTLKTGIYKTTNETQNCPSPWSPMIYIKFKSDETTTQIIEIFLNSSNYNCIMMRRYNGTNWSNVYVPNGAMSSGDRNASTQLRILGNMVFDTTLNKPVWYNGTNWVDANGNNV